MAYVKNEKFYLVCIGYNTPTSGETLRFQINAATSFLQQIVQS